MRIDSHQHFWKYDFREYPWIDDSMAVIQRNFEPVDLEPILHTNGFDGCIAVQAAQTEEETVRLLEYANSYKFIKAVVGWVPLTSETVEERLELYSRDPHFKGVRHTSWDQAGEFMVDLNFLRGIRKLGKHGFTYDILCFDYQLPGALKLVENVPEQRFVLDHMAKPTISGGLDENWVAQIKAIGDHPNTYCKISGLVTQAEAYHWKYEDFIPFLDVVVEAFGTSRLLFGSDWPVCLTAGKYEEVAGVVQRYFRDFPIEDQEKIFGQNAMTCYSLKDEQK